MYANDRHPLKDANNVVSFKFLNDFLENKGVMQRELPVNEDEMDKGDSLSTIDVSLVSFSSDDDKPHRPRTHLLLISLTTKYMSGGKVTVIPRPPSKRLADMKNDWFRFILAFLFWGARWELLFTSQAGICVALSAHCI
jgi:hypothetical protein